MKRIIQQSTIIFLCPCQKTQPFLPLQKGFKRSGKTYVKNDSVQYPNYGNLFGELIINDCNVDANLFSVTMMLRSETVLAFMPEVLSPVTVEQSLLQVITTLISTVLKTQQSVRRLKSRQATVITSMKSPTRQSKKRLTEPHMTFRRIMKIS